MTQRPSILKTLRRWSYGWLRLLLGAVVRSSTQTGITVIGDCLRQLSEAIVAILEDTHAIDDQNPTLFGNRVRDDADVGVRCGNTVRSK
jgi:hypothetical protein